VLAQRWALYGPENVVVTNGIPWYFRKYGKEFEGQRIQSVDPDGIVEAKKWIASSAAWFIQRLSWLNRVSCGILGDRFRLELDGSKTERIQLLANLEQGY